MEIASQLGQFCPIALASEVLAQKWMLLVLRELNAGATRFNEIRRGVPRISATLLKQRLDQLQLAGIVERCPVADDGPENYLLTEAGRELKEVLGAIGTWGQRWARNIQQDDLDPAWLVWAMHRRIDTANMPNGRTVIEIRFTDAPANHRLFWLVCEHPEVDVCVKPTGYDTGVCVTTSVRCLAEIWRGLRALDQSIATGDLQVEAVRPLQKAFPSWLLFSVFASTKRRRQ